MMLEKIAICNYHHHLTQGIVVTGLSEGNVGVECYHTQ